MPTFDKTGPFGHGPRTGRGIGSCGGGSGRRMGFGRCRGYGKGLGRYFGWNSPQTTAETIEDLQSYKKALQEEIEEVEKELANANKKE